MRVDAEIVLKSDAFPEDVSTRDLIAAGLSKLPFGVDVERKARMDGLRRRRFVDSVVANALVNLGWKQCPREGLLYCDHCDRPTVWRDPRGVPMHYTCADTILT